MTTNPQAMPCTLTLWPSHTVIHLTKLQISLEFFLRKNACGGHGTCSVLDEVRNTGRFQETSIVDFVHGNIACCDVHPVDFSTLGCGVHLAFDGEVCLELIATEGED